MPRLLSNMLHIDTDSRLFFERYKDKTFPYHHVKFTLEIGEDYLLSVTGDTRLECLKKVIDKLPVFVRNMEYISKFDLESIGYE